MLTHRHSIPATVDLQLAEVTNILTHGALDDTNDLLVATHFAHNY